MPMVMTMKSVVIVSMVSETLTLVIMMKEFMTKLTMTVLAMVVATEHNIDGGHYNPKLCASVALTSASGGR